MSLTEKISKYDQASISFFKLAEINQANKQHRYHDLREEFIPGEKSVAESEAYRTPWLQETSFSLKAVRCFIDSINSSRGYHGRKIAKILTANNFDAAIDLSSRMISVLEFSLTKKHVAFCQTITSSFAQVCGDKIDSAVSRVHKLECRFETATNSAFHLLQNMILEFSLGRGR
ncbi:hypothetical protein SILAB01_01326 [Lacticaseibacillus paracasei]|uniref:hypothetical protein n=1 Tax=Lacticaseibacillus paracasei TaxID=1597 RepID=UPI00091A3B33|nr:hypothetical protein [Lacticaseibacillus paracasei]GAV17440.1 hypothetical protein SILAB01_01326 [Lacticaseibacillus paracasei]